MPKKNKDQEKKTLKAIFDDFRAEAEKTADKSRSKTVLPIDKRMLGIVRYGCLPVSKSDMEIIKEIIKPMPYDKKRKK